MSNKADATIMKQATKRELTPKLRFPEFRDAGEWEAKPIAKVCDVLNARRLPISSNIREKGSYPYYGASGIVDYVKDFIFDERLLLVGEDGAKWGAFEKTAFIAEGKYWVNNHAHVLRATAINDTLLENYLTMLDLSPFITGAAPPKLTLGKLREIPVPIPPTDREQQKIADCLASLDELIAAETQKLATLKTHKKGLMQQLFPAEGETLPKLRFPEFRDDEEWEEKHLKKLANVIMGSSPSSESYNTDGIGLPFMQGNADIKDGLSAPRLFTSQVTKECKVGDILLSVRAPVGSVAKSIHQACIGRGLSSIRALSPNKQEYLYQFLVFFESQWHKISQGGTFDAINSDDLKDLQVTVPHDSAEQQKIADCLASLDELIAAETQKLATLKTHKKGLMQQLFPALDEVQG